MLNEKDLSWLGHLVVGLEQDPRYSKSGAALRKIVAKLQKQSK